MNAPTSERHPIALRWLGTAGFQVRYRGHELALDPYLSRPPGAVPDLRFAPEDLADASLVLITHGHFDHAQDAAAVALASGARVVAPRACLSRLRRAEVPEERLVAAEDADAVPWGEAVVRVLPSRHIRFDARMVGRTVARVVRGGALLRLLRLVRRYPIGSNSDFLLELGDERVLHSGSGGGDWEALARLAPTTFLLPFAGRSDVIDHYLAALRILRPRAVVLHHFDDFFPAFSEPYPVAAFAERMAAELPEIRLTVPEPGVWFELPRETAPATPR
ncbi:MAG: MBL fold metallo-hydrolase [Deltaproteobacteria bacterium]|nr:MAG: MBL fold metallo-hydrolase [Deltaproteobacteria bacterium]